MTVKHCCGCIACGAVTGIALLAALFTAWLLWGPDYDGNLVSF